MFTRLAACVVAGMLLANPAFATTDSNRSTRTVDECTNLIATTEQTVKVQSDVGDKAQAEVDAMLLKLKEQCSQNQFEEADRTAEYIRGLVATE